ncbi:MFS general substrate transporter [Acephala macrosclerotiorum]|nr:MFS general substrate transporter [Acephala macrosclerotiorum]
MATIIYKKFFKKTPSRPNPCEHQRSPRCQCDTLEEAKASKNRMQTTEMDGSRCPICKDEHRRMRIYRRRLMAGLFLPFLVQSLDSTIIASALPFIASDFHQLSQLNWIISAFNLTSATFIPFWGQFSDVFGRYAATQSALCTMLLGSILCSASPTTAFPMLLVGRAFQGIGCAGLLINTKIILADKVSLKENAKNNTIFTIVGGVGYGAGPVLGGYLTNVSWRWCFIINIPIGVCGLALAHFVLRPELLGPQQITRTDAVEDPSLSQTFSARLMTIDFGGQLLFLFGMGLLVLALTWAGSYYSWTSVNVLAPLIIAITLIFAFLTWEHYMLPGKFLSVRAPTRKAMIPIELLFTRNAGLLIYINIITGMATYAVYYFVDLYFALVLNYGPGKAGVNLLYYMPGLAGGAYIAMFMCNKWPLQTFFPLLMGTIIEPLSITILAVAVNTNHKGLIYGMLAMTGVGTGIRFMPGTLHGVGYFPKKIASIVSLMSLSVSLGGVLATTIMLSIFNNELRKAGLSLNNAGSSSFGAISGLPESQQAYLREKALRGIVVAFFAITAFMWLGVVAALGLGNVRIGKDGNKDEIVAHGSYVGSLIWRRRGKEFERSAYCFLGVGI